MVRRFIPRKPLSEEHRRKSGIGISKALKGRPLSETHKANLRKPRKFPRTETHRKNLGIALKKVWTRPDKIEFARERCISMIQNGLIGRSKLEEEFEKMLVDQNIEFERQKRFGSYLIDFFIPSHGVALEVDGTYWHKINWSECKTPAQKRNYALRGKKLTFLRHNNIDVKFIPEEDILKNRIDLRRLLNG